MPSKNIKKESSEKLTGRYISLRKAGEPVYNEETNTVSIEQKIIQKILSFPLSHQQKILDYAETLESGVTHIETAKKIMSPRLVNKADAKYFEKIVEVDVDDEV